MSIFYIDTSALAKRYFPEVGSAWLQRQIDPKTGNSVILAEITLVEMAAAIAAKHRATNGITRQERDDALGLFLKHCNTEYSLIPARRLVCDRAVLLTQSYRLRGYDAVQLASALTVNEQYAAAGLPHLILISADRDMLSAAQHEGLSVDDPNAHP